MKSRLKVFLALLLLSLTEVSAKDITLAWNPLTTPADGIGVYLKGAKLTNFTRIKYLSPHSTSVTIEGLEPDVTYEFRLTSISGSVESAPSGTVTFKATNSKIKGIIDSAVVADVNPGDTYVLESSTNLITWKPEKTQIAMTETINFPINQNESKKFFRLCRPASSQSLIPMGLFKNQGLVIKTTLGNAFQVEQSTNMMNWTSVSNFIATDSISTVSVDFSKPKMFFRVKKL